MDIVLNFCAMQDLNTQCSIQLYREMSGYITNRCVKSLPDKNMQLSKVGYFIHRV